MASELAANAVIHSRSGRAGGRFVVQAAVRPANAYGSRPRIKALSGPAITPGCRPDGLDIVQAIAGGDNWGIDGDAALGRVAWAQLGWPGR